MIARMGLQQLQGIVGGEIFGNADFQSISIDTRTLRAGDLFVALKGPNFNGNHFVENAGTKGACAAMVSESMDVDLPRLHVLDARLALGQLGAYNRARSPATVVALTGSQGKTSVKEMTASILAQRGAVHYTQGNLNNDIGAPLTLLGIGPAHKFAVIELGANHKGEIAYTTQLVRPDIALINNVAATHLEGFGSLQGVAEGKAELWQGLGKDGLAVVNLDDPNVVARVPREIRKVGVSAAGNGDAAYYVSSIHSEGLAGSIFQLHTPQGSTSVTLHLPGKHNVANALAAAALAMEAGASLVDVVQGLKQTDGAKGRLKVLPGRAGAIVIDDSYNASPSSFRAAIDVLAAQPGIRVLVAGDMGELGEEQETEHRALGQYAATMGIDHFLGMGALCSLAVAAFGGKGTHFESCDELSLAARALLAPGVSVLVKGSRSAGMERVVQKLTEQED